MLARVRSCIVISVRRLFSTRLGRLIMILAITLVAGFACMRSYFQSPSQIIRQIGTSNDRVELAWTKNIGIWFQSSIWTSDTIYAYTTSENLIAFDSNTGLLFWEKNLPINEQGVTALLATNQIVFTVTATDVHAYRSLTGDWIWSTRLGDGHVSISAQTEGSLLRVYYGDKIFEISQGSGEILNEQSIGDINWIQNGVVIHHTSTVYLLP